MVMSYIARFGIVRAGHVLDWFLGRALWVYKVQTANSCAKLIVGLIWDAETVTSKPPTFKNLQTTNHGQDRSDLV